MSTSQQFASTPKIGAGNITNAETSYTTPTNVTTILTAGSNGTKVWRVIVECTGTSVAGLIRLFIYDGSTYRFFDEIAVSAVTASTTTACYRYEKSYPDITIPSGYSMRAASSVAQANGVNIVAIGADL